MAPLVCFIVFFWGFCGLVYSSNTTTMPNMNNPFKVFVWSLIIGGPFLCVVLTVISIIGVFIDKIIKPILVWGERI